MISSPLSSVFIVLNKQSRLFVFQLSLFIGRAIVLSIGAFLLKDIVWVVLLFGMFNAIAYFILSVWILSLVKAPKQTLIFETVALVVITVTALYLLKKALIFINWCIGVMGQTSKILHEAGNKNCPNKNWGILNY